MPVSIGMTLRPLASATAICVGVISVSGPAIGDTTAQLRILETTDIHVHVVDYDYYADKPSASVGLAKVATLIEQARAENVNSLMIDNGDLIQGNPLGDYMAKRRGLEKDDVHPVYKAMNLIDYDVGNIGNHEFNYGLDFLGKALAGAKFPYVSANVYQDDGDLDPSNDKPYFAPYVILERELLAEDGKSYPIKIGVIGFVPPQVMQWDKANLAGKLIARDIVDTAHRYVPEMRALGADVVIAVPHSGLTTAAPKALDENATYELSLIPGIDAILFGHAHQVFPSDSYADMPGVDIRSGTINGVPATMPGFWGSHLGLVDLNLRRSDAGKWRVTSGTGSVRAVFKRDGRKKIPLVDADPKILAAVAEEHQATIAYMSEAVGKVEAPINSYFALVADDPSIQIVTNAQKWYVEELIKGTEYDGIPVLSAGAPFKAGGRGGPDYYTLVESGDIALRNVADLYIYPNTLRAVLLTGGEVREWLEMSAGAFNRIDPTSGAEQALLNPEFPSYNYDVIDGVTYEIDLTQPARYAKDGTLADPDAHRITELKFDGAPIDPEAKFIVATNNYRAGGGGNFPRLDGSTTIIEAPDENRTVLANYIFELKSFNPSADMNWSFKAIPGDVNVTFSSSPSASSVLDGTLPIEAAGQADDGFAKYRMIMK
ncbi:bifunctional 2',3'-cyclic-nucleotide 2'-phosphodiesterase/3'-nucleotidase [Pelagibius sp. Alg239-R121]|uniref:bifunctional 2',3'-cyclic-nucleotide 2'-phosphodiesterase/3'-nucleotidase n=1 Tax=Pelagibius sp. Alg239-R121 TaxID=2993448 RepID=UPI0024A65849|nr:bifunctional 2',3'-cyclic-nucleotide 2'-phosphodiesterase/3'-nucleotidase [Pelagibius sp. Alg239-R121]